MSKKKGLRLLAFTLGVLAFLGLATTLFVCDYFAGATLGNPAARRSTFPEAALLARVERLGILAPQPVRLTTADGFHLNGWYYASTNRAAILLIHGYKANCKETLPIAISLHRLGYGVLFFDLRAHNLSDGESISFGVHETADVTAAYHWLLERPEVDPPRIGVLGNSMGSVVSLLYAAQEPGIRAVVAQNPYATLAELTRTNVARIGLPVFPLAGLTQFFMERRLGISSGQIDPITAIGQISPRPVFILVSGQDIMVGSQGGQRLYEAAGEPRQLWYEPELGHLEFHLKRPAEFEQRVGDFFDRYLLQQVSAGPE